MPLVLSGYSRSAACNRHEHLQATRTSMVLLELRYNLPLGYQRQLPNNLADDRNVRSETANRMSCYLI